MSSHKNTITTATVTLKRHAQRLEPTIKSSSQQSKEKALYSSMLEWDAVCGAPDGGDGGRGTLGRK